MVPKVFFCLLSLGALAIIAIARDEPAIYIGVDREGLPTPEWLDAIKSRITLAELDRIRSTKRALAPEELAWLELIRDVAPSWAKKRESLLVPFRGIDQPKRVAILVGNQIGDDGFTSGEDTVCLDLAALAKNYGDPRSNDNRGRLVRIIDHEYTHLLHHAWLRRHPIRLATPLDRALRDLIVEGVGNYRSLSDKWVDKDGDLTELAKKTLVELRPIFVDRLTKLRTATVEDETALTVGLSRGPFSKKWGALTVALWLSQESKGDDRKLHKWVKAGPNGILLLAKRNLPSKEKKDFSMTFRDRLTR